MRRIHRLVPLALGVVILAGCLTPGGRKPEDGLQALKPDVARAAAELPPEDAIRACVATGDELARQGYHADAAAEFAKAQQLGPDRVAITHRLAVAYDRQGLPEKAAAEFARALAAAPDDAALLNDFGYFEARRGHWTDAEALLKRSVQADPKLARAWVNLGTVYAKSGKVSESVQAFGRAVTPAEAKYNAGVILAGIGDTAQAKVLLAQAGAEDPRLRTAADALLANRPKAEPVTKRD